MTPLEISRRVLLQRGGDPPPTPGRLLLQEGDPTPLKNSVLLLLLRGGGMF